MRVRFLRAGFGAAILLLAGARGARAALFLVSTEAQLQAALPAAQSNGQDDTIQLAAGVYDTNDNGLGATFTYTVAAPAEPFGLTIEGAGAASTTTGASRAGSSRRPPRPSTRSAGRS